MAAIGLDATYAVDREPSGIAVYTRQLIESLAGLETPHRFELWYRLSRLRRRGEFLRPTNPAFSVKIFQEPLTFWLPRRVELFHSLAQRPPAFRFKREVVTVHDVFPLTGRDYSTPDFQKKFSDLLLQAVERAARVITPSRYTAEQLAQHAGLARGKIRVVPHGVIPPARIHSPEERARERERRVGQGRAMVLSVAVLQVRKNILNALRALERLGENYRLVLAGGNGHGAEAVHEFIRRERLEPRVSVLGHVPDEQLAGLYQAASVFLLPSFEEGFGLPVLEAMAHGVPVVASRAASLPEVGGAAALYVDPRDPQDIAQQLRRVVEDSALAQTMVAKGLERAREFTWQRAAEETMKVYEEVLAG